MARISVRSRSPGRSIAPQIPLNRAACANPSELARTAAPSRLAQLLPPPVREVLRDRSKSRAQAPDLFMYARDLSDWFFCEVKGPRDHLRKEQIRKFELLADMTAKPVRSLLDVVARPLVCGRARVRCVREA
jgi:VRR-NUC domain-containing protein